MNRRVSRLKHLVFYTIMIGSTIAVCFVILEFGIGAYYQSTESKLSYTRFDPILGWRLRPGTYWVKPSHTFSKHPIHVNEHGLRDGHQTAPTTRNAKHIVILGDSFTFAVAIRDGNTFPVQLETLLNRNGQYEVMNAGVPGYGTAQELLLMKELAAENVVGNVYLLMIFINDILDNLRIGEYSVLVETPAQPGFVLEPNGKPQLVHYPRKQYSAHLAAPGQARFVTVEVVRNRVATFLQTKPTWVAALNHLGLAARLPRMPALLHGWYSDEILKPGVPLTKALINEIRAEADRHHARLLISIIPSPLQVYPDVYDPMLKNTFPGDVLVGRYLIDPTRPQRILAQVCRELELPVLDLLPVLVENNDKELFIPADGHFSQNGHAVAAESLAAFINAELSRNAAGRGPINDMRVKR